MQVNRRVAEERRDSWPRRGAGGPGSRQQSRPPDGHASADAPTEHRSAPARMGVRSGGVRVCVRRMPSMRWLPSMTAFRGPGVWLWRWRRNPLRRRSDALEAWIVLAVWSVTVIGGVLAGLAAAHSVERGMNRE